MKQLLLISLLLPSICMAQKDPCRKINRTTDISTATISYKSPHLAHITAIREFRMIEFFGLHIYVRHEHDLINTTGIIVSFDDGSVYKEDGAKVDCREVPVNFDNRYATASEGYQVQGFIHITGGNYEQFANKRITRVQLNEASALIPEKEGEKIMLFVKCLADVKPE